jgi:hypothetical protein
MGGESAPAPPQQEAEQDDGDDEDEAAGKVGSDIKGGIWIYKPSCTNRGRGIKVITGLPALKELCYGKPMGGSGENESSTTLPYKGIVQKYIRNPLLVTQEGYKFDVRCYLLIARNYPTTLAFYHPGYCRLALKPYTIATAASLEDNCVHLTNAAIQKKDAVYKEEGNKELQVRTPNPPTISSTAPHFLCIILVDANTDPNPGGNCRRPGLAGQDRQRRVHAQRAGPPDQARARGRHEGRERSHSFCV